MEADKAATLAALKTAGPRAGNGLGGGGVTKAASPRNVEGCDGEDASTPMDLRPGLRLLLLVVLVVGGVVVNVMGGGGSCGGCGCCGTYNMRGPPLLKAASENSLPGPPPPTTIM